VTILPHAGSGRPSANRRHIRALAAVGAAGMIAAACTSAPPDDGHASTGAKLVVKIAYVGALTGDGSALVTPGFQAAQLAFGQADEGKLGDLPVTITLVGEDTQASPEQASAVVAPVAGDESFVGVIGPTSSSESEAVGAVLDQAGIPFMTPSAADPGLAQNAWTHWFRAIGNSNYQGPSAAGYIAQQLGPNCVVVASDDTSYGQNLAGIVQNTLEGDGVSVVSQVAAVRYPTQKKFADLVRAIKVAACAVVFYGGYAAQAASLRAQMTDAGLTEVTLMGGDGIKDDVFTAKAGRGAEGTIATCLCADVSTSADPAAQRFVMQYTAQYGRAPGEYAPEAWDVAQMYIAALKAGKTTRASITEFFRSLSGFQGVTKTYTFASNGELDPSAVAIYLYQVRDGEWTVLGPAGQLSSG
jgi:branched-chain amino acid transport system substrate-binding protein